MKPWLLVITIIVGIYLLLLIANIIFVISFYVIMKKHDRAMYIILKNKYDLLKNIIEKAKEEKVELSQEIINISRETTDIFEKELLVNNYENAKQKISYLQNLVYAMVEETNSDKLNENLELSNDAIKQLDNVYRSNIIMYNADVLGYNYWVRFLPCRYIWLMFRFKLKDLIS